MSKLTGKVVIVTGASKGIGAGIAKAMAAAGASVVVNYASGKDGAERIVGEIVRDGGKAVAVHADVAKPADVKRLFEEARRHFDRVDSVVNNAGVFSFQPLAEVTVEEYRRQYDINVLGALLMTQEALKYFGTEGGSVINVSSVAATSPPPMSALYSSTKGAVDTMTMALGRELAPRKIRVNVIAPGGVETEGSITAGFIGSDFERMLVANTPLGRIGRPSDIGPVAVFLASDDAAWITGERITVSGGQR